MRRGRSPAIRVAALLGGAASVLLGAGACGRPSLEPSAPAPAQTAPALVRSAWVPTREVTIEPELLQSWVLAEEENPLVWRALLAEPNVVASNVLGPDSRAVAFAGDAEARVVIKGELDPLACTDVALRLLTRGEVVVRAALVSSTGDMRTKSPPVAIDTGGKPRTVQFPLRVPEEREPCNRIVLFFEGAGLDLELGRVDLLSVPLAGRLPDALDEARPVSVAGDWRPAVGLSSARGLSASFDVPLSSGAEIVWALAAVPLAREPDPLGPVTWRVRAAGQVVLEGRVALTRTEPARWQEIRVAAEPVSAGWSLELELASLDPERAAVCAVSEPSLQWTLPEPATVLLITSDTHRGDHLGVARDAADVRTPTLDALSARGVFFERCIAPTNVTNPSHVSLMTAVSPRDTRILGNASPLAEAAPTLAEAFRDAGWATFAALSAHHLDPEGSGLGQGFDRVSAPETDERRAAETLAVARSWLPQAAGKPLFLWVHLFDAHTPYAPPAEFDRLYYGSERDPSDPARPVVDARGEHGHWLPDPLTDLEFPLAQYRAEVTYLDAALAALLAEPRLADAVTAFVGDHGESLGEHDVYWDHAGLYAQTVHVPLIFAGPGVPAGRRVGGAVSALDVARTLLSRVGLQGTESATDFPGRDLLGDDLGGGDGAEAAFAVSGIQRCASVTKGRWHLILWLDSLRSRESAREGERHVVELFDLDADPQCVRDLSAVELDTATALRRLLVAWLTAGGDLGWRERTVIAAEREARLAQMGYFGNDTLRGGEEWIEEDCDCAECERFRRR